MTIFLFRQHLTGRRFLGRRCSVPPTRTTPRRRRGRAGRTRAGMVVLAALASVLSPTSTSTADAASLPSYTPATTIQVADGVELAPGFDQQVDEYLAATELTNDHEIAPLLDPAGAEHLHSAPLHRQDVSVTADALTVVRRFRFQLEPDACADPEAAAVLGGICIDVDRDEPLSPELAADVERLRGELADARQDRRVVPGLTVEQARAMDDHDLLETVLNQQQRTLRQITTLPLAGRSLGLEGDPAPDDENLDEAPTSPSGPTSVEPSENAGDRQTEPMRPRRPGLDGETFTNGGPEPFDRRYMVTGFTKTIGAELVWDYTLAESNFWHGRYYVQLRLGYDAGIGVRVPLAIDVDHVAGGNTASWVRLDVDPIDATASNFDEAGIGEDDIHDGDELVAHVSAWCHLKVSIPGPDINTPCGSADSDFSRDFDAPFGGEVADIGEWWLPAETTGLSIGTSIVGIGVDLGLVAQLRNGRVEIGVDPLGHTTAGLPMNCDTAPLGDGLSEDDDVDYGTLPRRFQLADPDGVCIHLERNGSEDFGLSVSLPRYRAELALQPALRLRAWLDVGVYSKTWSPTWVFDSLGLTLGLDLPLHEPEDGAECEPHEQEGETEEAQSCVSQDFRLVWPNAQMSN